LAQRVWRQDRTGWGRDLLHTPLIRWISAHCDGAEELKIDVKVIDVA